MNQRIQKLSPMNATKICSPDSADACQWHKIPMRACCQPMSKRLIGKTTYPHARWQKSEMEIKMERLNQSSSGCEWKAQVYFANISRFNRSFFPGATYTKLGLKSIHRKKISAKPAIRPP
ncbi:hypothetical protein JXJ21_01455 [candidate division KSB1 bacterium]|nr:hypothetical protein [candidate division KSB1 bacterium]